MNENSVMIFPIKKRINTELFMDKMAALFMADGQIKDELIVRVVNHWD